MYNDVFINSQKTSAMNIKNTFEICTGSVIGNTHSLQNKNNQDAFTYIIHDQYMIAVVCDGCSKGSRSEMGSTLLASVVTQSIQKYCQTYGMLFWENKRLWAEMQQEILAPVRTLISFMPYSVAESIQKHFLSTVVGYIITPEKTCVFICGDGVYGINDEVKIVGPFLENKPPYFAYQLLPGGVDVPGTDDFSLQVVETQDTNTIESIFVGTDGVEDLIQVQGKCIPGQNDTIPELKKFWEDDTFFNNPAWLHNRLRVYNTTKRSINWETKEVEKHNALLPDDTTLIVSRKKRAS